MPRAFLITGDAGAGKTTVINALAKKGYSAYSTDEIQGVTELEDMDNDNKIVIDQPPRPTDWSRYAWNLQEDALKKLLATDDIVFIACITSNQEKFYDLFEHIFILDLDVKTLEHRIQTRTTNEYGKHPSELRGILDYHPKMTERLMKAPNKIVLDASQSLEVIVRSIEDAITNNN